MNQFNKKDHQIKKTSYMHKYNKSVQLLLNYHNYLQNINKTTKQLTANNFNGLRTIWNPYINTGNLTTSSNSVWTWQWGEIFYEHSSSITSNKPINKSPGVSILNIRSSLLQLPLIKIKIIMYTSWFLNAIDHRNKFWGMEILRSRAQNGPITITSFIRHRIKQNYT